jgi:hypothetical protein
MNAEQTLSLTATGGPLPAESHRHRLRQVNLQLVATGLPSVDGDGEVVDVARGVLDAFRAQARLLADVRCPADQRIETFLADHFADQNLDFRLRLPGRTLVLGRHGIARELSLPADGDKVVSPLLTSYRLRNGVLHNPKSDRRTTQGTFHVVEGGLPVPFDKFAVPKRTFAEMFRIAMSPPDDLLVVPFTSDEWQQARSFVSLLLRPTVVPAVPGVSPVRSMEVRFFAPGSLVSNLDFVESIFGNGGDPFLPSNDAGLDTDHWTGHTGCVILAPHLVHLTKKQLHLPHWDDATERQRKDGMCWRAEDEKYNNGGAFKLTCRTAAGVVVTILADNYYGYCKKEVKTQISYAANLLGNAEEEHAGGAIAFASYSLGDETQSNSVAVNGRTFADVVRDYGPCMDVRPEGYGVDKKYPDLIYMPEDARSNVNTGRVWWTKDGQEQSIPLLPGKVYMTPSGFKVRLEKHPGAPSWRLVGTRADGTFCHKPSTVSGGGKSEISKSLKDYMLYGPIFTADADRDLDLVESVFNKDYGDRWRDGRRPGDKSSRPLLSPERSLGSVIKLLTPSPEYADSYNAWLATIPDHLYPIVFIIKRFSRHDWAGDWRQHFGVDIVNGFPGHELKYNGRKLVGTYLRIGLTESAWRTYKVRQDFAAATKIQTEDDITASTVVPARFLSNMNPAYAPGGPVERGAFKFAVNTEYRLFQRPDDAVHRGLDKQTEADMARPDNFISNFEPLTQHDACKIVERVTEFDQFTDPMRQLMAGAATAKGGYVVCSSEPRIVNGKRTANPRYLQVRPDLMDPMSWHVAEQGVRLLRKIPADQPVYWPVDAVLMGRRNNPAEYAVGIRPLAVFNPIHYQELPELFMDFICSLTGKSPSTTGAGSEGALTKAPFNMLRPTADLNTALVSFILTGLGGFSTAAGYIGPNVRVDHDISLLVPEIWCRLSPEEREPSHLIAHGFLEKLDDFTHNGKPIPASRLGYRITPKFVQTYFGRIFDNPTKVFDDAILRPETQDAGQFADGILNIVEAQQKVAAEYLADGSVADACPPLQALLHIMATGTWEGKTAHHPDVRAMFTRDYLVNSYWYKLRLKQKQRVDVALWDRHVRYLDGFLSRDGNADEADRLGLRARRAVAAAELERVGASAYLDALVGTLGAEPLS